MNEIYIALPFLQFVVSLFLASIVMFSDSKSRRNRLFVLFLVALALWGLTIFGMRDSFPDRAVAYSWEKAALAVIPFSGIFFYHFVFAYTRVRRRLWVLACIYGLGTVSAVLSLTGQSATGMVERFYGFAPQLGWAFPIVLCAAYPPVLLGIYDLTRELRSVTDAGERARLHALRLGGLVSVLGGTSDFAPSLGLNVYPLGIVGNLLFAVIATWAVTQYRLMNLRLALRGGVAHTVMSSFVFGVYAAVYGPVWLLARNLSLTATAIVAVGTVILVGVFVRPLVTRAESLVDKIFFRERFDRLQALGQLNEVSKDIRDLRALTASLVDTIRRAAQTDWATIMLPDQPGQRLVVAAESGIPESGRTLRYDGCVASWLRQHKTALRAKDFFSDALLQAMSDEERATLEANGTTVVIPLIVDDSLTGLIALGPKLVGGDYSGEDVAFLVSAADQVAMALQSAKLYADAQRVARERTALAEERTALAELSRVVSSTLDLDRVFERCEEQVRRLISYDRFVITTMDTDRSIVTNAFVRGAGVPGWEQGQTHALSGSPLETVIGTATGQIVPSEPVSGEAIAHPERVASAVAGLRSTLATPLLSNGRVIGTMNLESRRPDAYGPQDLALAERVGAQITNAIANSQHYEQAIQLAEEREARIRLDAENRELQRADEERSAFISTVSHELKTPLTSLSAFTDILLRNRDRNL
ncbi:MAG: GAF domain-containing protein, partial [Chloroflexi bacterium]|nr:GAF domain-containing protein [Chloroflexota bacterium]